MLAVLVFLPSIPLNRLASVLAPPRRDEAVITANVSRWPRLSLAHCESLVKRYPAVVMMPQDGVLWCPSAKSGSSSTVSLIVDMLLGTHTHCDGDVCSHSPTLDIPPSLILAAAKVNQDSGYNVADRIRQKISDNDATTSVDSLSAAARVVDPSSLTAAQLSHACNSSQGMFAFTFTRNPWERMVSAYVGKVALGATRDRDRKGGEVGLYWNVTHSVTFSQFIRWLATVPADYDEHFEPDSLRCGPAVGSYSFVGRMETYENDIKLVLDQLGWSHTLYSDEHISSLDACKNSTPCVTNIVDQLGSAGWALLSSMAELSNALYHSDPQHDLVGIVRQRFADDIRAFDYPVPGVG